MVDKENLAQYRRNNMAQAYRVDVIEAGEPWDEMAEVVYENVRQGIIEYDSSSRQLRLTELGKAQAESIRSAKQ